MSDNFPNISTDGGNMSFDMRDPNNTDSANQSAGGASKIKKTDMSGESGQPMHTSNDASMQIQGNAPSGENSSGIPAAQPIQPLTFGDPNNTAIDRKDEFVPSGPSVDKKRYGFDGPAVP